VRVGGWEGKWGGRRREGGFRSRRGGYANDRPKRSRGGKGTDGNKNMGELSGKEKIEVGTEKEGGVRGCREGTNT